MPPPKSIISMGIAAPPEIQAKLEVSTKQVLEAGYDLEMFAFSIDDFSSDLEKLKERLRSRRWDGVVVGFGVRGNPKYTEKFETLVNTASDILPGIKFGFSSTPDDLLPCVVRNFGETE